MKLGALNDLIEAFTKRATGDTQAINGVGIRFNQVTAAQFNGVDAEVMRKFVEMDLYGITRLRRPMTSLGATRRLVGKEAHPFELVAGKFVGYSLQCTGVVGGSYAIRAVCTTIQKRTEVHGCQRAVALDAGLDPHFHGMAAAVDQKHFFARAGDLDGPASAARQLTGANFV